MDRLKITLLLPPPQLSPNWRGHFMAKARATKKYRTQAFGESLFQLQEARMPKPWWREATVQATFWFKDLRRRDRDNMLASLKAAFDGLADAHIVVNDSCITHLPVLVGVDKKDPRVELEIVKTA